MEPNYPLASGVDSNGMLSREIDDHLNLRIYSMLGTCTRESVLKYQMAIAQKSVFLLENKIGHLQGKLQMQAIKHENELRHLQSQLEMQAIKHKKAKEEASLNARALKRCIASCEQLKEEMHRDQMHVFRQKMPTSKHVFRQEMQTSMPTEPLPKRRNQIDELSPVKSPKYQALQDTGTFSGHHMKNIYVDGNDIVKQVLVTNEGLEDGERPSNWIDGRQLSKKRLLQELDPNIEDLGYRFTMPEFL